tara:strand:- start:73 stop:1284 length:1212 start_codon:yes stop_codon:yes gene_type:complete
VAQEFNNGDIAELILAAAIASKFQKRLSEAKLSKEQIISIGDLPRVTSGEVKNTLKTVISNSFSSQFNVRDRDIINKRISRVTDNISVVVKIPANSERYISAQPIGSRFSNFENIFNSATNFVNADTEIKRKVFNTQFNLKKDSIEIQGVGTKGQTETKVDVRVDITTGGVMAPRTSSQISLKFQTGQFAQTVGLEFDKFADIFEELGITDYTKDKEEFDKAIFETYPEILGKRFNSREDVTQSNEVRALKTAARKVFTGRIKRELDSKINNVNFKSALASFIKKKATLNESGVELVKFLDDGRFFKQTFGDDFTNAILSMDLAVTIKTYSRNFGPGRMMGDETDNPTICIYKKGGDPVQDLLVEFRYRSDSLKPKGQNYYLIKMRTLVLAGESLYTLGVTNE